MLKIERTERPKGTVSKALGLLDIVARTPMAKSLTEIATAAGFDKATTRRFLVVLSKHGFVEQVHESKKYRLGSAFLRFARIREATMPLSSIVQPILDELAKESGETVHVSMLTGNTLSTIATAQPLRATSANVDISEPLPLYATASGIACLAFAEKSFAENYVAQVELKKVTPNTVTSKASFRKLIAQTYEQGISRAERSFGDDVIGTASPIFDWSQRAIGAVAVAAVATRFDEKSEARVRQLVLRAAIAITEATGGVVHENVSNAKNGDAT
jgi:IclR family transcriptional regulator, acetate operon repressor